MACASFRCATLQAVTRDPKLTCAATSTVLQDDAAVRITRWDFDAGARTGHHVHSFDYVVVPLTPCHFLLHEAAGSRRTSVQAGEAYRRAAGVAHDVVNDGTEPLSFIEIEFKRGAGPGT